MSGLLDYKGENFTLSVCNRMFILFGSSLHLYTIEGWGIMGIS